MFCWGLGGVWCRVWLCPGRAREGLDMIGRACVVVGCGVVGVVGSSAWGQVFTAKVFEPTASTGDQFGEFVAIDGDTAVVGMCDGDGVGMNSGGVRVYERDGEPCSTCGRPIRRRVIGQRASYFCVACQR